MDLSQCLLPDQRAVLLSNGIWSTLAVTDRPDSYDKMARVYDWMVGNSLYNRLIWGNGTKAYSDAAQNVLAQSTGGPIIDIGCGSLVFTAKPYQSAPLNNLILFDRSLGMMQRGKARLPEGQFVQGDAFAMPFQNGIFNTVMAWGFLHVVGSKSPMLSEMCRIAKPGASVALSTLVLSNRRIGNTMLQILHNKGEADEPEAMKDIVGAFESYFTITQVEMKGNMLFLNGRANV
jgi:ubiquinone/menaquinone biosynthesis C-methylase UbiE